jgi:hypothetical protein
MRVPIDPFQGTLLFEALLFRISHGLRKKIYGFQLAE